MNRFATAAPRALVRASSSNSSIPTAAALRPAAVRLYSSEVAIPNSIPPAQLPLRFHDKHRSMMHFSQVRGVGRKTANEWASAGCESLDDVLAHDASPASNINLSDYQRSNIREWTDHLARVPAAEMAQLENQLQSVVERTADGLDAELSAVPSQGAYSSYKIELALRPTEDVPVQAGDLLRNVVTNLDQDGLVNTKWWSQMSASQRRWEGFIGSGADARQISIKIAPPLGAEMAQAQATV